MGQATLTYDLTYTASQEAATAKRYSDLTSTNKIGESTYTFDAAGRQTFIQHKNGAGSNIAAYTYSFDYGGRITQESRNGTNVTYAYDTTSMEFTQCGSRDLTRAMGTPPLRGVASHTKGGGTHGTGCPDHHDPTPTLRLRASPR